MPNLDRFQPPDANQQREWILCEECNDAQASVMFSPTKQYVCESCQTKLKEEKEEQDDSINQ